MDPLTMMALVQAGSGAYRYMRAQKGISDLEAQDRRKFMDASSPLQENIRMSRRQEKLGMSPESRAFARQNFTGSLASTQRQIQETGGGQMSNVVGRLGALESSRFATQLGAQDQAIRDAARQNIMQSNQQLMQLDLQDISQENQEYLQQMAGYGQARQDARKTMLGAAQGVAMGAMMGYYNKPTGGTGGSAPFTTSADGTSGASEGLDLVQQPGTFPTTQPTTVPDDYSRFESNPLYTKTAQPDMSKGIDFSSINMPQRAEQNILNQDQMGLGGRMMDGGVNLSTLPTFPVTPQQNQMPTYPPVNFSQMPYSISSDPKNVDVFGMEQQNFEAPVVTPPQQLGLPNQLPAIINTSGKLGPFATPMQFRPEYGQNSFLQQMSQNRLSPYQSTNMAQLNPSAIDMGMYTPVASPYRPNLPYDQYGQYNLAPYSAKRR